MAVLDVFHAQCTSSHPLLQFRDYIFVCHTLIALHLDKHLVLASIDIQSKFLCTYVQMFLLFYIFGEVLKSPKGLIDAFLHDRRHMCRVIDTNALKVRHDILVSVKKGCRRKIVFHLFSTIRPDF